MRVDSLQCAFLFLLHFLSRLDNSGCIDGPTVYGRRQLTTSSAFSGIGTPETTDADVARGVAQRYCDRDGFVPIGFKPLWAIEKGLKAQQELLHLEEPPEELYNSIMELVPQRSRAFSGFGGQEGQKGAPDQ